MIIGERPYHDLHLDFFVREFVYIDTRAWLFQNEMVFRDDALQNIPHFLGMCLIVYRLARSVNATPTSLPSKKRLQGFHMLGTVMA